MESALVDRNDSEIQMETCGDGKRRDQQGPKNNEKADSLTFGLLGPKLLCNPAKRS